MSRVRVLRLIEYRGEREWVEKTVKRSIHGTHVIEVNHGLDRSITGSTIGKFPEDIGITGWEPVAPAALLALPEEIERLRRIEMAARAFCGRGMEHGGVDRYRELEEALGLEE